MQKSPQQKPPRVSFYLGSDEAVQAMKELKEHYGTDSMAMVSLRTLIDHAEALREPKPTKPAQITYSRRIF